MKEYDQNIEQLQAQAIGLISSLRSQTELESLIKIIKQQQSRQELGRTFSGQPVTLEMLKARREKALQDLKSGKLIDDEDLDKMLLEGGEAPY